MDEAIIFLGIPALLIWLSVTYENKWLKLVLKMFALILTIIASYMPLTVISMADKEGMYDLYAFTSMWFFMVFMAIWFVVLMYEMFMFFVNKKKTSLEETQ